MSYFFRRRIFFHRKLFSVDRTKLLSGRVGRKRGVSGLRWIFILGIFPVYLPTYNNISVKIYNECFVFTCGLGLNPVRC